MGEEYSKFPPVRIAAYSDNYDLPEPKVWGDYWFKEHLLAGFKDLGYPVSNKAPRILLHLFGEPMGTIPKDTCNILWIHSHPDRITPEILSKYQKIFCASGEFIKKIIAMGFDAEALMIPTNMTPVASDKLYDIVFVGNTRQGRPRKIICDLGEAECNMKIWGWGWKGLIPDKWYGGEYFDNSTLNKLYASAKIVLNDHHEDMRREGFINPRIPDVLASGGFVISDKVLGMEKVFDNCVPVYESPEELRDMVDRYLCDDIERDSLSRNGQKIALKHTYRSACGTIIRHIESISATLF